MATLIPALSTCSFETSGERRLANRLEQKLEADYLLWYDVPIGPKQTHPDFVLLHPRRGLLILETKDWKLETILRANRQSWDILGHNGPKVVINPLAQARHCAIQVVNALERDPQLVHPDGPHQGKLAFPWGHGVVLTRITRKQFETAGLGEAIEPHYVICKDEMEERTSMSPAPCSKPNATAELLAPAAKPCCTKAIGAHRPNTAYPLCSPPTAGPICANWPPRAASGFATCGIRKTAAWRWTAGTARPGSKDGARLVNALSQLRSGTVPTINGVDLGVLTGLPCDAAIDVLVTALSEGHGDSEKVRAAMQEALANALGKLCITRRRICYRKQVPSFAEYRLIALKYIA